jgi:hypothetical protein
MQGVHASDHGRRLGGDETTEKNGRLYCGPGVGPMIDFA